LFGAGMAALVAAFVQGGCSTQSAGVSCSAGQTLPCNCNGSLTGTLTCDSSGTEGACQCPVGGGVEASVPVSMDAAVVDVTMDVSASMDAGEAEAGDADIDGDADLDGEGGDGADE
jgi:hypothetical protein